MTSIKLPNKDGTISEWSDYDLGEWILSFGSFPVEVTDSKDFSASYEMERAHIFKLQNRRYAYVEEVGCSCYEPYGAKIESGLSLREAEARMKQFIEYYGNRDW